MSKKAEIISPIAIDLGAKYTGVYFANYPAGSSIKEFDKESEEISKEGKVYKLDRYKRDKYKENKYMLLMADRTAARHQRRCYDRRQMVKRLFKLIWEKYFVLEWDKDVQQTTSFLFNRRGVSFLTEEYDPEIESGRRFRSEYFEEVKDILENKRSKETKKNGNKIGDDYIDRFINKFKDNDKIKIRDLHKLICHLSNLELKPLRKYFNCKGHKENDFWDEKRLAERFDSWIMKQWRVGEKDRDKKRGEKGDYQELRQKWRDYKEQERDTVVNFWLKEDPFYTIPPYQDINNRRPPRCQSLVLNAKFLNNKKEGYPQWREWLQDISNLDSTKEYLGDYKEKLEGLKSSSKKSYFANGENTDISEHQRSPDDLDARVFQFILDRTKDSDPLKLNEIYSYAKKYHQCQSTAREKKEAKEDLEGIIQNSELSIIRDAKRTYKNGCVFNEGTFLHLVYCYYKMRRRARDGRLYIHPKYRFVKGRGYQNTGRYDANCLLTYCNHKPRQKRYQMLDDFAALLRVSTQDLKKFIEDRRGKKPDEKLVDWLESIKIKETKATKEEINFTKICAEAAEEQKKRQGCLKLDIQKIYWLIYHKKQSDTPAQSEIEEILKQSTVEDGDGLYKLCEKAKELLKQEIFGAAKILWKDDKQREENIENLNKNPASAVYMLAQINNIIFKKRSGNSKTCAVCSADNAQRMQMITDQKRDVSHAKASRLPAIATRVIDGAVMRMARIVGGAIAKDKWEKIENELKDGKKVCIPIITESNQFEFEPSLKVLKNKTEKKMEKKDEAISKRADKKADTIINDKDKESRIKEATSNGFCPYTGEKIGDDGEIDHIIPRSSKWGTLNDEANLIYVSRQGNQDKDKEIYNLGHLKSDYKKHTFGKTNKEAITAWIEKTIGDGESEDFKFGRYYNFTQLKEEEQKAFRHALFLEEDRPLRKKVINAINNRNRTFVNGTQRYFAEVIANNLYKKARRIKKHRLLSFDYFGVGAWSDNRGDNIKELRSAYEERYDSLFAKYKKVSEESIGKSQLLYSHLIDAQMAFAIAANKHKEDGSLRLKIDKNIYLWPVNRSTGEIRDEDIFKSIRITPEEMKSDDLERRKVYDVETHHRRLLNINNNKRSQIQINYKIHRDGFISERFFPLIKYQDKIEVGFSPKNVSPRPYKEEKFERLEEANLLQKCKSINSSYEVWIVNKKKAQEFLMKAGFHGPDIDKKNKETCKLFNDLSYQEVKDICKLLDDLSYQTVKKPIQSVLGFKESEGSTEKPPTVAKALEVWDKYISKNNRKFNDRGLILPFFHEWKKLKSLLEKETDKDKLLQVFLEGCSMFCPPHNSHYPHNHKKVRGVYSLPVKENIGKFRLSRKTWNGSRIFQTMPEKSAAKYNDLLAKDNIYLHTILSKNSVPKKHYVGYPEKLHVIPRYWTPVPDKIKSNNSMIEKAEIIYQDAGRCRVKLEVNEIKHLPVPQDKEEWEGKIILHNSDDSLKNFTEDQENHHCLGSEFEQKWFDRPFKAIPEKPKSEKINGKQLRGEVRIKKIKSRWCIEFTVNQTGLKESLTKNWVKKEMAKSEQTSASEE